jgi:glucosyl-3-phosphoglycerate synthase
MSFGILQTFINRLHRQGKIDRIPDMETFYRRFEVEEGSYKQLVQEVVEEERPPMIEIDEYTKRAPSS